MIKNITPESQKVSNKWIPRGMVWSCNGPTRVEHLEWFKDIELDTKEIADNYFIQRCKEKYEAEGYMIKIYEKTKDCPEIENIQN